MAKKSQIRQFREAARAHEADEDESKFNATLKKVARHKPVADPMPKDDSAALFEGGKRNIQRD